MRPSPACVSVYVYMTHMTPHTQEHANTTHKCPPTHAVIYKRIREIRTHLLRCFAAQLGEQRVGAADDRSALVP